MNNPPLFIVLAWHNLFVNIRKLNSPGSICTGGIGGHSISQFKFQAPLMSQ